MRTVMYLEAIANAMLSICVIVICSMFLIAGFTQTKTWITKAFSRKPRAA